MKKFIAILVVLLLLLCSCRTTKVVERVDTIRVERVVEAAGAHAEAEVVHDTTSVLITRYDTLERVTERIVVRKGKAAVRWVRDTIAIHDTIAVAASSQQHSTEDKVTVAEPVEWRKWAAVAGLLVLMAALQWWAKKIGER